MAAVAVRIAGSVCHQLCGFGSSAIGEPFYAGPFYANESMMNCAPTLPNMIAQPLPKTGATQERTQEAVGCSRLFGSNVPPPFKT
jgi:hypothetical protein